MHGGLGVQGSEQRHHEVQLQLAHALEVHMPAIIRTRAMEEDAEAVSLDILAEGTRCIPIIEGGLVPDLSRVPSHRTSGKQGRNLLPILCR
jgi:hypothetical protein